jgi:hypothetical protein
MTRVSPAPALGLFTGMLRKVIMPRFRVIPATQRAFSASNDVAVRDTVFS